MDTVTVTDVLTKFDISGISSNLYIVAPQNLYFAFSFVIIPTINKVLFFLHERSVARLLAR